MSKKPIIGITPMFEYDHDRMTMKAGYYNGIIESGGLPVMLAVTGRQDCIDEYVDMCDGILISGGRDMDASYFGEENHKHIGNICPYRDEMDIKLIKTAEKKDKSIFGICRGSQSINVALGGTLYQDIYSQIDKPIIRHDPDAPIWHASHSINIEKDSQMFEIFGQEKITVNSNHHQAIKTLANKFKATAFSSDGIIEAIEHTEKKFILGVQCHPEQMWERHPIFLKLFKYFVDKCK